MNNVILIVVFVLIGLALLIFILWLVMRKSIASDLSEAARFTEVEISRAKRFGKRIAFIFVEMNKKTNDDFMQIINSDPTIIREYDVVISIGRLKYLLIWSDAAFEFNHAVIIQVVKKRLSGIRGIKELKFAFYPEDGSTFSELLKNAKAI